ncbi:MAG: NAD-dependent deacylase [Candidatus Omnitrophota bacterium]
MIPEKVKDAIKKARQKGPVACLTGAGISAESGIPTFRGKGGLWEKYDPQTYAYPDGLENLLRREPKKLADFVSDFYTVLLEAKPNPAHISLAALEKKGILESVITQNIDDLHALAGSQRIIELHGNAFRIKCAFCSKARELERKEIQASLPLLKMDSLSRLEILKILSRFFPRCSCGSRFRIDIVLFGEPLPEEALTGALRSLERCSLFLLIGSSLEVYPAASLPSYAKEKGAVLIEINSSLSALSHIFDYSIKGQASDVMPVLLKILEG